MLKHYPFNELGHANYGWLNTHYHFSFSNYYNPKRMNFGSLRVINDDIIAPHTGFDTHPHQNMEIITYVIGGHLTHGDSMNNTKTVSKGHFQYMSAGTGVYHSEKNDHDLPIRLLQMWVLPEKEGLEPHYGDYLPDWEERVDKLFHVVSGVDGDGKIKIYQDINLYVTETSKELTLDIDEGRQAYVVNIEGDTEINGLELKHGDGLEVIEESITIKPHDTSQLLIIELKKSWFLKKRLRICNLAFYDFY